MRSTRQREKGKEALRVVLAVLALWLIDAGHHTSAIDAAIKPPGVAALKDPESIKAGRVLFAQACSYCHGQEGDAGKTQAFRDHLNWNPQDIYDAIADGKQDGANVMPSWKDSIAEADIWKLVAFIHSLAGQKNNPAQ